MITDTASSARVGADRRAVRRSRPAPASGCPSASRPVGCERASSMASRPFSASPASTRSSSDWISARSPIRTNGWSSTSPTLMVMPSPPSTPGVRPAARPGPAARAAPPRAPRPGRPPRGPARSSRRCRCPAAARTGVGPSSTTSISRASGRRSIRTRAVASPACRTTLVKASWMIRKAAWSTAAGSGGWSAGDALDARPVDRRRPAQRPGRRPGPARAQTVRCALGIAEHPDRGPQLGQRVLAGPPDRLERVGQLRVGLGPLVQQVPGHPGLHGDHRQAVADHVVHVAGDPQPLLVGVAAAVLLAFADARCRVRLRCSSANMVGQHGDRGQPEQLGVEAGIEQAERGLAPVPGERRWRPGPRSAAPTGPAAALVAIAYTTSARAAYTGPGPAPSAR